MLLCALPALSCPVASRSAGTQGRSHSKRVLQAKPGNLPAAPPPTGGTSSLTWKSSVVLRHLASVRALHLCFQFCPMLTLLNTRETAFSLQLESVTPLSKWRPVRRRVPETLLPVLSEAL